MCVCSNKIKFNIAFVKCIQLKYIYQLNVKIDIYESGIGPRLSLS